LLLAVATRATTGTAPCKSAAGALRGLTPGRLARAMKPARRRPKTPFPSRRMLYTRRRAAPAAHAPETPTRSATRRNRQPPASPAQPTRSLHRLGCRVCVTRDSRRLTRASRPARPAQPGHIRVSAAARPRPSHPACPAPASARRLPRAPRASALQITLEPYARMSVTSPAHPGAVRLFLLAHQWSGSACIACPVAPSPSPCLPCLPCHPFPLDRASAILCWCLLTQMAILQPQQRRSPAQNILPIKYLYPYSLSSAVALPKISYLLNIFTPTAPAAP